MTSTGLLKQKKILRSRIHLPTSIIGRIFTLRRRRVMPNAGNDQGWQAVKHLTRKLPGSGQTPINQELCHVSHMHVDTRRHAMAKPECWEPAHSSDQPWGSLPSPPAKEPLCVHQDPVQNKWRPAQVGRKLLEEQCLI